MSTLYPDAPQTRFLELTNEEWALLVIGATLTVAMVAAVRGDVTLWPAMGVFFTALTVGHLCLTARRFVAFPDLIASAACLQYVIVPWLSEVYPPTLPMFRMAIPSSDYLRYALPATVALWIGLHLPSSRRLSKTWEMPEVEHLSKRVQHTLDGIIILGLVVDMFVVDQASVQWGFLAYLVSSFRFVGALGWMVTRTPGWQWRVAVVLIHLTAVQSTGGLFYLVVHWGGYFLLVYAFMKRWRWQMAVALVVGMLGLSLLQSVKPTFRTSLSENQVSGPDRIDQPPDGAPVGQAQDRRDYRHDRRCQRLARALQSGMDHRARHDARAGPGAVCQGPDAVRRRGVLDRAAVSVPGQKGRLVEGALRAVHRASSSAAAREWVSGSSASSTRTSACGAA